MQCVPNKNTNEVFCFVLFCFERDREIEHEQAGAEREGDTESKAGSSELSAQSPKQGSNP